MTTDHTTEELMDLARAAARGACRQAMYSTITGDEAASLADQTAERILGENSVALQISRKDALKTVWNAAALGVSTGLGLAQHRQAQDEGRADALGLDPEARQTSGEGRYGGKF